MLTTILFVLLVIAGYIAWTEHESHHELLYKLRDHKSAVHNNLSTLLTDKVRRLNERGARTQLSVGSLDDRSRRTEYRVHQYRPEGGRVQETDVLSVTVHWFGRPDEQIRCDFFGRRPAIVGLLHEAFPDIVKEASVFLDGLSPDSAHKA